MLIQWIFLSLLSVSVTSAFNQHRVFPKVPPRNDYAYETRTIDSLGFLWEHAAEFKAAVVFAEHRYYGASMPFGNDSFKDPQHFGYLTAEQALADYALLIRHLRNSDENFQKSAFIAFGGSYGGMLAAWFRMKYPNVVAGSIAASAPIWLFPNMSDCHGFQRTTTEAFVLSGGENCRKYIGSIWDNIREMAKKRDGRNLDIPRTLSLEMITDAENLINYIADFLGTIAMVNYPYESSFLGRLPANPVKYFCRDLSVFDPNDTPDIRVSHMASAVRSLSNYTGDQKCLSIGSDLPGLDASGWELQTCLEMTTPMCSDGVDDMFPRAEWNDQVYSESCFKKFAVRPRMNWADVQFWGKDLRLASNIVFSNGNLDPWSSLGVLQPDQAPLSHVIRIPNGAHHLDLRASNPADPQDVIDARKSELKLIKEWIAAWNLKTGPKSTHSAQCQAV